MQAVAVALDTLVSFIDIDVHLVAFHNLEISNIKI